MAALPVHPGARVSDRHGVPELNDRWLTQVQPIHHTVRRSAWWVVSDAKPRAVARWYADHAPPAFRSGGTVGGQGDGRRWVFEVYDAQPGAGGLPPTGTTIEVQTTRIAGGVGVRATVAAVWAPARPLASYVQDVSSIDVHTRYARRAVLGAAQHQVVHDHRPRPAPRGGRHVRRTPGYRAVRGGPLRVDARLVDRPDRVPHQHG